MAAVPPQPSPEIPEEAIAHRHNDRVARAPLRFFWMWVPLLLLLPGGVAFWAIATLVELPESPRCWNLSSPQTEPSVQMYCADLAARKQTPADLRRAILIVASIPSTHPLRQEGDRLTTEWTQDILRLGEGAFQEGQLDRAIEIANQVPVEAKTRAVATQQIQTWERIWAQAEDLYAKATAAIDQGNWYETLTLGRDLLQLGNRYWATTRYQELMRSLQAAKEDKKRSPNREKQFARMQEPGSVEDLIARWEREQDLADAARLSRAAELAASGEVEQLKAAVDEARQILYGTPRYEQAQALITTWQQQVELIEDRPYLERAVQLANQGDITSLRAAINEAGQIGWGRALYDEARDNIEQWRGQVYELQLEAQDAALQTVPVGDRALGLPPLPPVRPSLPTPAPAISPLYSIPATPSASPSPP